MLSQKSWEQTPAFLLASVGGDLVHEIRWHVFYWSGPINDDGVDARRVAVAVLLVLDARR